MEPGTNKALVASQTHDDLDVISGKHDQPEGRLQQRYGYPKDQANKEVDDWYGRQKW